MNNTILYCKESCDHIQPRERISTYGPGSASDLELLAAMLGSGTRTRPVKILASAVLKRIDHLGALTSPEDLSDIPGLGPVKRVQLCAAFEFFRRICMPIRPRIKSPADLWPSLSRWADREQECFICLSLNGANELISCRLITIGILNRTLVHPREVFSFAIHEKAASIIVAHNHPSGHLEPSQEDLDITRRLKSAGEIVGIPVFDHLIFGMEGHYSLLEHHEFE